MRLVVLKLLQQLDCLYAKHCPPASKLPGQLLIQTFFVQISVLRVTVCCIGRACIEVGCKWAMLALQQAWQADLRKKGMQLSDEWAKFLWQGLKLTVRCRKDGWPWSDCTIPTCFKRPSYKIKPKSQIESMALGSPSVTRLTQEERIWQKIAALLLKDWSIQFKVRRCGHCKSCAWTLALACSNCIHRNHLSHLCQNYCMAQWTLVEYASLKTGLNFEEPCKGCWQGMNLPLH